MAAGSVALPALKTRRKRKRPWSPETKVYFCSFGVDSCLTASSVFNFMEGGSPFMQFLRLLFASLFVLIARYDWRMFKRSRDRDENGD